MHACMCGRHPYPPCAPSRAPSPRTPPLSWGSRGDAHAAPERECPVRTHLASQSGRWLLTPLRAPAYSASRLPSGNVTGGAPISTRLASNATRPGPAASGRVGMSTPSVAVQPTPSNDSATWSPLPSELSPLACSSTGARTGRGVADPRVSRCAVGAPRAVNERSARAWGSARFPLTRRGSAGRWAEGGGSPPCSSPRSHRPRKSAAARATQCVCGGGGGAHERCAASAAVAAALPGRRTDTNWPAGLARVSGGCPRRNDGVLVPLPAPAATLPPHLPEARPPRRGGVRRHERRDVRRAAVVLVCEAVVAPVDGAAGHAQVLHSAPLCRQLWRGLDRHRIGAQCRGRGGVVPRPRQDGVGDV